MRRTVAAAGDGGLKVDVKCFNRFGLAAKQLRRFVNFHAINY